MPEEQRKARILVIDDEKDVLDILSAMLTKGGHEVETASDGGQRVEIFEKKGLDLVFTDLGMPGMSLSMGESSNYREHKLRRSPRMR